MKREFLQGLMEMPKEVIDAIMAENGKDISQLRQSAQDWEQKYHAMRLDAAVGQAIAKARGRNQKAITALLDLQALEGRLLKATTEDLRKRINAFAESEGYDLIVDATAAPFSKKELDVTPEILKAMGVDPEKALEQKDSDDEGK